MSNNNIYKYKIKFNSFGNTLELGDYANLHQFQYLMNYSYLSLYTFFYNGDRNITNLEQRNIAFSFMNSKTLNEIFMHANHTRNIFEQQYTKDNVDVLRLCEQNQLFTNPNNQSQIFPNFTVKYGDRTITNHNIYKPKSLNTINLNANSFNEKILVGSPNELKLKQINYYVNNARNSYVLIPFTNVSIYKNQKTTITVKGAEESTKFSIFGGLYNNGNEENSGSTTPQNQAYISNIELKTINNITPQQIVNARNQSSQSNTSIKTITPSQEMLPLKVYRVIQNTNNIKSYKMNNLTQGRYVGSELENDDLTVKKLADNELFFTYFTSDAPTETSKTAKMETIHEFELTNDVITKPITLTYIDNNITKKTVDVNYQFIDYFREILKNADAYTNTLPLEQRYYIGHNNTRGETFHIGKWIYSSNTVLNTVDEYTDVSKFSYIYSLFETYKEQDEMLYLYNTLFADMYFHYYYMLITTMQVPELQTHKYKLPSLYTVNKLIHEYHTSGKHKYLYFAFFSKFIAGVIEHIYTLNKNYTKQPAGFSSILYNIERTFSQATNPFANITNTSTQVNSVHIDLILANVGTGSYADYVNDLTLLKNSNSAETNANHLTNYVYKQLLLVNNFSGYDEQNPLNIAQFENQLKTFIKKNILSRYFVYMSGDYKFNRNGILNKYDNLEDYAIHADYGVYITTEQNKIDVINSEDGRLLYDFSETIGIGY